jgi:3-hydroxyacyl-[acyl-carrier-protein] dehydratase
MEEVYRSIPHRPPFLFIDRIIEVSESGAIAEREVRADEPHFAGHYPGNPLMPGVLLCEAVFQTAAVYMTRRHGNGEWDGGPRTPVLARIQQAKFKRMVRPGDLLRIEASFIETLGKFHFMRGKAQVDGKLALSVEFALAMLEN